MSEYLNLLALQKQNMDTANPMRNFMSGAQDYNTIMRQQMDNKAAQLRMDQDALENPMRLDALRQSLDTGRLNQQVTQRSLDADQQASTIKSLKMAADMSRNFAAAGDIEGLRSLVPKMQEMLPPEVSSKFAELAELGDIDSIKQGIQAIDALGLDPSLKPAGIREFEYMTQGMTPEQKAQARLVATGQAARAGDSAAERIARTGQTEAVAASEAVIKGAQAGAAEEAELGAQQRMLPAIRAQIKRAESEATAQGETVTTLTRAKAALPGLLEVSDKLKKLADVATYTTTGWLVDLAAKELGFGSTKGGTARSSMTAIVDNQVLPLLRDTFGAAFTAAEGDKLRDSLLDPDASPEAKKATLDAFIDQKYRNIETQERELGISGTPNQPARIKFDAQGNVIQ